jgi:hypothetical protein
VSEEPEDEEIYYEEPNLLGGIEKEDYIIVFGAEYKDLEEEA